MKFAFAILALVAVQGLKIDDMTFLQEKCQCFANGEENEKFCESGNITDPHKCQNQTGGKCHWGPEEKSECVKML